LTLSAGTRLGPYEVLSPLGAGGMGEVYRARDERLGREVAIKVLPAELASNAERLKRFEKEARSASALSHPNIVTVYDIGDTDGVSWIAMERVEGETLRRLLANGALPLKRLLGIAAQIADGLAKAHATGIVHRDLKPENVMVSRDGVVKILDFGLAKLVSPSGESEERTQAPTVTAATEAGVILGTVGYMSPEQALGDPLDFRSDQFSFGSIVYEMAAGKRAFVRPSAPETLAAIIRNEPEPLTAASPGSPIPLRWIVERCLAKDREERYASTRDLARDLVRLRDGLTDGSLSGTSIALAPSKKTRLPLALGVAGLVGGVGIAALALRGPSRSPTTYRPVSFHRGAIGNARLAPDGKTILYSAAWEGRPAQIYSTRVDSPESTALPLPSADVMSISATGKVAILILHANDPAAIAEVSLAGGAPRELVQADPPEGLQFSPQVADYAPGEDRLAVVRKGALEFPMGKVLVPAPPDGQVFALRFLLDGKQIAYLVQRGTDQSLGIVDLSGKTKILTSGWEILSSLVWNPVAKEIWFSGRKKANQIGVVELHAVTLSGEERLVAQNPQLIIAQDIASDGRVLARSDDWPETMMCLPPGAPRELDLTWLDFSEGLALSADGKDLLFAEGGAGAGATGGTYMRKTDGSSAAVRLTDGWIQRQALSADEKWVAQVLDGGVRLVPVGPGESRTIRDQDIQYVRPTWFPDGKRLLLAGSKAGGGSRMWVRDLEAGPPRPVTPEGVAGGKISPDGRLVAAGDLKTKTWALYPLDGGDARPIPGVQPGDEVLGFDESGGSLNLSSGWGGLELRLERIELASGKRTFLREVSPADATGVTRISSIQLTPDGKSYCYSFMRALSRLYVVDGLK
jgi:eukaryotic-like serine/threonine-protein kinase